MKEELNKQLDEEKKMKDYIKNLKEENITLKKLGEQLKEDIKDLKKK